MNLLKNWLHPKKAAPASKPEVETEEVPTMILDGEQFYTYRRFRTSSTTAPQSTPPMVPLHPSR
ncbi:MAG: hypothetical protein WAW39_05475 [Prosthecobacter sp.]|uniref:hypothetical protein n=1 Tax=Prosthecobacter sp. TaxID=1965333 RepID=UPI003BB1FED8